MSGIDIFIGGSVDTSPFGKYQPFEGVTDGTVALWDAQFNKEAGVPAHGATLKNLMATRMAAITGLTPEQCAITVANYNGGGFSAAERTSKGGLHVANTRSGSQNDVSGIKFDLSREFWAWLLANTDTGPDYAVQVLIWARNTRGLISAGAPQSLTHIANNAGSTSNFFYFAQGGGTNPGVPLPSNAGLQSINQEATGPASVFSVASRGWAGNKPATVDNTVHGLVVTGAQDAWAGFNFNKAPSLIIYRAQLDIVDLSDLSGSLSDRAAGHIAKHNALLAREFGLGGRYANDTFTPAATLKA